MKFRFNSLSFSLVFVLSLTTLLTGCAFQTAATSAASGSSASAAAASGISGTTYGGQQPIYNSHVYVMQASTTAYGGASKSLLLPTGTGVQTDTTVIGTPTNPAYYLLSNQYGNFFLTNNYTCTPGAQVYILSLGGSTNYIPTSAPITTGTLNPMIGLMATLGTCPAAGTFAGSISFVWVNEVSTVATAYALAGFATDSRNIGSCSTGPCNSPLAQTALANAFANASQLYDIQDLGLQNNGSSNEAVYHEARATTPAGNGTVPQALIDTLANILAACVNDGANVSFPPNGTYCQRLYNYTNQSTDTANAAIYIAQHPTSNVSNLFNLQTGNVQFNDDLGQPPTDFTLGIKYTGTGLSAPTAIATDASGNAWVTSTSNSYLSKLTALGAQVANSPVGIAGANYVALDTSGLPWVTSTTANVVSQLTGLVNSIVPYTNNVTNLLSSNSLANSAGIASDGNGRVVIATPGTGQTLLGGLLGASGSATEITGTGNQATYTTYTDSLLGTTLDNYIPLVSQVAIDSAGYAWLSGDTLDCTGLAFCYGEYVERISLNNFTGPPLILGLGGNGGLQFRQQVATPNCFLPGPIPILCTAANQIQGIAIDKSGNAWVAVDGFDGSASSIARITTAQAQTNFTGGGLNNPFGVTVDGNSNIWVANSGNNTVSEFTSLGTPITGTTGYTATSTLSAPTNLDADISGDVWLVNSTGNSVTELIGAATPVVRPLSAAVATGKLGQKP